MLGKRMEREIRKKSDTHKYNYIHFRENILITTTILISAIGYMVIAGIDNLLSPLSSQYSLLSTFLEGDHPNLHS